MIREETDIIGSSDRGSTALGGVGQVLYSDGVANV
jgi:hypothetical protein